MSIITTSIGLLVIYLAVAKFLRFRQFKAIHTVHHEGQSKPQLSVEEAYDITMKLATLEFPATFTKGVRLGMFKSYSIPSISGLLQRTGHFDDAKTAARRAANTGALLTEIFFHPPGSSRGINAIARTNFLHAGYRSNGHITNDDMLYTLGLSILEPIRLINIYEWRQLSSLELDALATYWKSLGEYLYISYLDMPSSTWDNGVQWLNELEQWCQQYEEHNMRWAESNHKVSSHAVGTLGLVQRNIVNALLEDERRTALGFTPPHRLIPIVLRSLLAVRRFTLRHLCLPRFTPVPMTSTPADEPGHYWSQPWSSHPWYLRPTKWSRYGPSAWWRRLTSQPCPGDEGYEAHGFAPENIGPDALRGKGHAFVEREKARLAGLTGSRCPFTGYVGSLCPFKI